MPTAPLTVALIVGHAPSGKGAVSAGGVAEYDFNTDLRRLIAAQVSGVKLLDVRRPSAGGAGIAALAGKVNAAGAHFAVEMHFNAAESKLAKGCEALFWHTSARSRMLAGLLVEQFARVDFEKRRNGGLLPIENDDRGALLLRRTNCPCVIAEPFFGSNLADWNRAVSRKADLAIAYARAIEDFARYLVAQ